jgi:hypothetical protein
MTFSFSNAHILTLNASLFAWCQMPIFALHS